MSKLISTRQAAKQLNISYGALLYRVRKRLLPVAAIVGRGHLFHEEDVKNYNPQVKRRRGRPSRPLRFSPDMTTVKELSLLSGRSPDQIRYDIDVGKLAVSGRLDHTIFFLPDAVKAYVDTK